jgi:hypothetical protein
VRGLRVSTTEGATVAVRRARTIATCLLVSLAMAAGACSQSNRTGEVSARVGKYGATLETSTTAVSPNASALPGSSRRSSTSKATTKADITSQLLQKLKDNPELVKQLSNLTPEELSKLTGLDTAQLNTLGLTPASVAALGSAIVAAQGGQPGALTTNGVQVLTPAVLSLLTGATGELTGTTKDTLKKIDPAVLTAILGAASQVDPSVTLQLGSLLAVVDPNGLGQFQGDKSALAVIAVLASAALGRDVSLQNLPNIEGIDPQFKNVLGSVVGLVEGLTPQVINQINNITGILGPNTIRAIGGALALLQRPEIGDIVRKAVQDPVTLASSIGAAMLLIPGLAEAIAPYTFSTAGSRTAALGALFAVALVRMDAPGVRVFLEALGLKIPPEFLPQ